MLKWALFVLLSLIWGSSFILMKEGMSHAGHPTLTAYQVASIRMISAGLVVLPFAWPIWKKIQLRTIALMVLSGLLGSFFPAYLFCVAETKIDSSLAGCLNALTPVFTILVGVLFFKSSISWKKMVGVGIAFTGSVLLLFSKQHHAFQLSSGDLLFVLLIALATLMYGFNVNIVSRRLKDIGSLQIAAVAFSSLILPAGAVLLATGFNPVSLHTAGMGWSIGASCVLGIMGTALASILFYVLVKKSGGLFASMVTYGIPFVALLWGILAGEYITLAQTGCLGIILAGVYLVNR